MEWRIIIPVLCLIGILHLPGNAAETPVSSNSTNSNSTSLTNSTAAGTNQTANVNQTAATNQTTATNQTAATNQTTATNQTATQTATTSPAATATSPAKTTSVNVVFRILQTFKDVYSDLSNPETKQLIDNITNAFTPVYKKRHPNFRNMTIKKLSPGSIVADTVLEFDNTNNTSPNVTEVKNTLIDAIANENLSIQVDSSSINATDVTTTNANVTTAATVSTTTATTPAKIALLNVVFKINQTFKEVYSNLSHPETKLLTDNITTVVSPVYAKRFFKQFRGMSVRKLSPGSIVADTVLEFDNTNNTSPNVTEVKNTLIEAIANGILSIPIEASSINVTDISTTNGTTVTTTASISNTVSANNSPVLASMLTAFWMTLTSLLLSAVMH